MKSIINIYDEREQATVHRDTACLLTNVEMSLYHIKTSTLINAQYMANITLGYLLVNS